MVVLEFNYYSQYCITNRDVKYILNDQTDICQNDPRGNRTNKYLIDILEYCLKDQTDVCQNDHDNIIQYSDVEIIVQKHFLSYYSDTHNILRKYLFEKYITQIQFIDNDEIKEEYNIKVILRLGKINNIVSFIFKDIMYYIERDKILNSKSGYSFYINKYNSDVYYLNIIHELKMLK